MLALAALLTVLACLAPCEPPSELFMLTSLLDLLFVMAMESLAWFALWARRCSFSNARRDFRRLSCSSSF